VALRPAAGAGIAITAQGVGSPFGPLARAESLLAGLCHLRTAPADRTGLEGVLWSSWGGGGSLPIKRPREVRRGDGNVFVDDSAAGFL
jgi:hypothetical protein